MKLKILLSSLVLGMLTAPSLYALSQLSAGEYMATLTPAINEATADRIEAQLKTIQEITLVDVKPKDSTVHFTVKDNALVDFDRVKDAIKKASKNIEVSDPAMSPVM